MKTLLLAVAGFGLAIQSLQAAPYISGEIGFTGGATLNGSIASATAFNSIFGPIGPGSDIPVVGGTANGSYAGVPAGTSVSFTPFAFNVQPGSPIQLWTFALGPTTYSFEITSVFVSLQQPGFLNIYGSGVAKITGYEDTPGTWSITDTGLNGPVFTFGNVTVVPEPATSAMVLGFGALLLVARNRTRK